MSSAVNLTNTTLSETLTPHLPYTTRYGTIFTYHALLAALAWALLAPLSHLIAYMNPTTKFSVHRSAMLSAAVLTALSYLVGYLNAAATPPQHAILTNAVVFAVLLQSLAGALRPDQSHVARRTVWARAHRLFGAAVLMFSFFVVAHSLSVFDVDGWVHVAIVVMLVVGACAGIVTFVSGFVTMLFNGHHEAKPAILEILDGRPLLDVVDEGEDGGNDV